MSNAAAMVVLPKVNCMGKPVLTAIAADWIKGCEATKIAFGGQTYNGTKVYTVKGDYFKVLATPVNVLMAQDTALKGTLAQVEPMVALPSKSYEKVKALPSGKK